MAENGRSHDAAWEGEMFRLLAENVKDYAIFVVDPHRQILSWSKGAERLLGFTEEEVVGKRCDCFFTPEDVQRGVPQRELEQALATGRGEDDRWHMKKDGSRFWAGGAVTPLKDEAGRLRGFAKIMRDRTEMKRAEEAAHERERQLQLLTDHAPVLIVHIDADRRYKFVNKPFAACFGLHPREVVGKRIQDVLGDKAYAAVERHIDAVLAGERVEFEVEVPYAGLGPQVMRCAYDPELDASGRVAGFVAALVNVTEGRRAREALRESEERLRTLSDNLPHGAVYQVLGDREGRRWFTYISAGVERLLGVTPAEAMAEATALYGLVHEADRPRVAAAEEVALRDLAPFDCEFRSWTRSGSLVWVHARSAPRRLPTGQVIWEGIIMDVTARKNAEAEVARLAAESEKRRRLYEAALSNTPDLAYVFDLDHRFIYANEGLLRLWGKTWDEAIGKTCLELGYEPWHADMHDREIEQVKATRRPVKGEVPFTGTLGRRVYEYIFVPVFGENGAVEAVAGTTRDVTERRQAEDRYRTVLESITDAFFALGRDWRFTYVNRQAEKVLGRTPGDLIGKSIWEEYPGLAGSEFERAYHRVMAERVAASLTAYYPDHDRWYEVHVYPAEVGMAVYFRDVSHRVRAEERLRESQRREQERAALLETVLRATPTPIFIAHDRECRTMTGNPAAFQAVKTPEGQIVSASAPGDLPRQRSFQEYRDGQPLPPDELPMQVAAREGVEVRGVELSFVFQDGDVRHFYGNAVPLRNNEGQVTGAIASYVDITGLKQAQEKLLESESRFRQLAEAMPQVVWAADSEGRITYLSRHWNTMTGGTTEEGLGEAWGKFIHSDDLAYVRGVWQACVRSGRDYQAEYRLRGKDGQYRWQVVRGVPIRDEAGQVIRWYGSSTDIDDPKRLAESLREADRRKDEFLATLAHELRNPLAPLRNGLQLMKMAAGNAGAVEQTRSMMERQMAVMVRLIDDLLDVSRITRGKLALRREPVKLASVVRSAVEGSRPLIEASGHRLTVVLPPEPVLLDVDPARLAQVLSNLLTNAAKYTDAGGQIRLAAERHGGEVVVSVRDTGIGIAPEHLPRLFEMFSQVNTALERSQGGLGIGLSLVKGLVEMHGGTVQARSEGLGKGSEFIVRLPAAGETPAPDLPRTCDGDQAAARPRKRILVADDNRDAADSLALMLRLAGHDVHAVHDGQEAVQASAWFRPDVALLDIGMPRLNGFDAARRIREQPWGKNMVLAAITGWGQEEDKRRATEAGFDRHLTKPVDPAALEKLLAELKSQTA